MFDGSVGAGTVLWPFGGKHQITPPDAMVAKLPLLEGDTDTCTYMSWGFDPYLSEKSPFHGAVYAVTESVCKAVAAGRALSDIRLTLQEYFPKLGNDPKRWGLPFAALLGAFHAQHSLRLAAIGGKDSMSGSFNELDVPPTLVSFALAPGKASLALSPEFKQPGSTISLVDVPRDADNLPDFEALKQVADSTSINSTPTANSSPSTTSAPPASPPPSPKWLLRQPHRLRRSADIRPPRSLQRALLHLPHRTHRRPPHLPQRPSHRPHHHRTHPHPQRRNPFPNRSPIRLGIHPRTRLSDPTRKPIGDRGSLTDRGCSALLFHPKIQNPQSQSSIRPKVVIPAFPGTNSEYDSAKAFREAGADAEILVFRNLTATHIEESLTALAEKIRQSQILMFPGGFSAGDEPDGSAKFIATIIRSPRVADAIMDLLQNRDGLILGICNGFQALIKTGLVPYGEIRESRRRFAPTLVHNEIGRHISRYATTTRRQHALPLAF